MINIIFIINCLIIISFIVLILYLMFYGILSVVCKIKKVKINKGKWLKARYILMTIPLVLLGIYMIMMALLFSKISNVIVLIILGVFLILYSLYKCYSKIKDVDFFSGLDV